MASGRASASLVDVVAVDLWPSGFDCGRLYWVSFQVRDRSVFSGGVSFQEVLLLAMHCFSLFSNGFACRWISQLQIQALSKPQQGIVPGHVRCLTSSDHEAGEYVNLAELWASLSSSPDLKQTH